MARHFLDATYTDALERAVRMLGFDPRRLVQSIESSDSADKFAGELALRAMQVRFDPWVARRCQPSASAQEVSRAESWLMSVRLAASTTPLPAAPNSHAWPCRRAGTFPTTDLRAR